MIQPANVLMDIMRTIYFPVGFVIIVAHCASEDYQINALNVTIHWL
jgi:hypothetical protein